MQNSLRVLRFGREKVYVTESGIARYRNRGRRSIFLRPTNFQGGQKAELTPRVLRHRGRRSIFLRPTNFQGGQKAELTPRVLRPTKRGVIRPNFK